MWNKENLRGEDELRVSVKWRKVEESEKWKSKWEIVNQHAAGLRKSQLLPSVA